MLYRQRALSKDEWDDVLVAYKYYLQNSSSYGHKEHRESGADLQAVFTPHQRHQNKEAFPLPQNNTHKT